MHTLTEADDFDRAMLVRAVLEAEQAHLAGDRPFGALIAEQGGRLLVLGRNREASNADPTAHAEVDALRKLGPRALAGAAGLTLYASGEPCPQCAAAIFYCGIRRVVYAVGADTMRACEEEGAPVLKMGCREVFATGSHPVCVVGPVEVELGREVLRRHFGR